MNRCLFLLFAASLLACDSGNRAQEIEIATLAILNGHILTMDEGNPVTQAVAIRGSYIIATGTNASIEEYIDPDQTRVIDAGGRLITPGFNDAHAHLAGIDPNYVDLRYITNQKMMADKLYSQVQKTAPGEWIMGGNWEHEMFDNKQWPTKETIDSVSPVNPVILFRADGHSLLANTLAIQASGITKETADPFGGTIMRYNDGEPMGIFQEKARELVRYQVVPKKLSEEEKAKIEDEEWKAAFKLTASLGITSIQRPTTSLDSVGIDPQPYIKYKNSGDLTYRIYFCGKFPASDNQLKNYVSLSQQFPKEDNWIRFGFLKGHIDGTLGSGTMMVFQPFSDRPNIGLGLEQMPYKQFEERIIAADQLGLQLGIHAIGPRANDWVLDALTEARKVNGIRDSRHRIEHAQILREEDILRFGVLQVVASMQPSHVATDKRFAEKRMGLERLKGAYAWRSLLDSKAVLAFGSDYQVEPLNPLDGIYAAVSRKDRRGEPGEGWFPDQKLSVAEAIELYTLGSAYAEFMEDRKGRIKTNYLADLVAFDQNLLNIDPQEILTTKVDFTILDGKVIYERNVQKMKQ